MKKYSRLTVIIILSLIMIFALFRLGNIEFSWATLNRVNPLWYSMVVVSFYASVIARGLALAAYSTHNGLPRGALCTLTRCSPPACF